MLSRLKQLLFPAAKAAVEKAPEKNKMLTTSSVMVLKQSKPVVNPLRRKKNSVLMMHHPSLASNLENLNLSDRALQAMLITQGDAPITKIVLNTLVMRYGNSAEKIENLVTLAEMRGIATPPLYSQLVKVLIADGQIWKAVEIAKSPKIDQDCCAEICLTLLQQLSSSPSSNWYAIEDIIKFTGKNGLATCNLEVVTKMVEICGSMIPPAKKQAETLVNNFLKANGKLGHAVLLNKLLLVLASTMDKKSISQIKALTKKMRFTHTPIDTEVREAALRAYSSCIPPYVTEAEREFESLVNFKKNQNKKKLIWYDAMMNAYLSSCPPYIVKAKKLAEDGVKHFGKKAHFLQEAVMRSTAEEQSSQK